MTPYYEDDAVSRRVTVYCEPGRHRVDIRDAHEIGTDHGFGRAWRCILCASDKTQQGSAPVSYSRREP